MTWFSSRSGSVLRQTVISYQDAISRARDASKRLKEVREEQAHSAEEARKIMDEISAEITRKLKA
jgi:hypothetical protein